MTRTIVCSWLPAAGMALFPFIFVKKRGYLQDLVLLNHEKIHLRQQVELWVLPFYVLYLSFYLFNLIRFRTHRKAYLNIPFEQEAYRCENDLQYVENRKSFAWLRP